MLRWPGRPRASSRRMTGKTKHVTFAVQSRRRTHDSGGGHLSRAPAFASSPCGRGVRHRLCLNRICRILDTGAFSTNCPFFLDGASHLNVFEPYPQTRNGPVASNCWTKAVSTRECLQRSPQCSICSSWAWSSLRVVGKDIGTFLMRDFEGATVRPQRLDSGRSLRLT